MENIIEDKWSKEIAEKLNKFQHNGQFHPFTCGNGHTLIATENGWICEKCPDYHQYWYHDFMLGVENESD